MNTINYFSNRLKNTDSPENIRAGKHKLFSTVKLFACILICLVLSGCGRERPSKGNNLVIGVESKPTNLDPRYATDALSSRIGSLVYNGLLGYNDDYELIPGIAESWVKESDTHFIFHLRKDVRFHDGTECNAADVKYTYDSLLSEQSTSPKKSGYTYLQEIRVVNDYRVDFHLSKSYAPFLDNLTLGIIPRNWDQSTGASGLSLPPGTGYFKIVSLPESSKIMLEANPECFKGAPRLAHLEFRVIKDDSVRMLELLRGSIDLVQNAMNPDIIPQLRASRDLTVETLPGTTYKYIGFNLKDPVLQNKTVRQAVAHAINRDAIIDTILHGLAVKASGLLSPDNWAYEDNVIHYEFDPRKSAELMDEAGYPDPDGPGPLPRFRLVYKTSQNKRANRVAEVIKSDLQRVGIDVDILRYEWPTFYADIKKGNFQMFSLSWVGVQEPDIYYYIFHSSSFPDGGNRGRYENSETDQLLETARFELDRDKRRKAYSRVQKIIAEECPYVSMWHETNIVAMRNRVHGYRLYSRGDLRSLAHVWVDPDRY